MSCAIVVGFSGSRTYSFFTKEGSLSSVETARLLRPVARTFTAAKAAKLYGTGRPQETSDIIDDPGLSERLGIDLLVEQE